MNTEVIAKTVEKPVSLASILPTLTPLAQDEQAPAVLLASIKGQFDDYGQAFGQSQSKLWNLLGSLYESLPRFETIKAAKAELINEVCALPSVQANKRWFPRQKEPDDLLVTLLLGLGKKQKVTKSQWLKALRAAAAQHVKRTRVDFIAWLEQVGGVAGAGRSLPPDEARAKEEKRQLEARMTELKSHFKQQEDDPLIDFDIGDEADPGDLVLILAHVEFEKGQSMRRLSRATAYLSDPKLVVRVAEALKRSEEQEKRSTKRKMQQQEAARAKNAKRLDPSEYVGSSIEHLFPDVPPVMQDSRPPPC
ncbi:hypothetical protein ACFSCW_09745 [Sphingomonas tabacisoli]|uniref:Uncharacterized protein n=1 Tax=Sphingomonas tabacisoli TaxID=2249466 RepID=A0ABW4I3M2_9SPHN